LDAEQRVSPAPKPGSTPQTPEPPSESIPSEPPIVASPEPAFPVTEEVRLDELEDFTAEPVKPEAQNTADSLEPLNNEEPIDVFSAVSEETEIADEDTQHD
jgi:hypothetical protein